MFYNACHVFIHILSGKSNLTVFNLELLYFVLVSPGLCCVCQYKTFFSIRNRYTHRPRVIGIWRARARCHFHLFVCKTVDIYAIVLGFWEYNLWRHPHKRPVFKCDELQRISVVYVSKLSNHQITSLWIKIRAFFKFENYTCILKKEFVFIQNVHSGPFCA